MRTNPYLSIIVPLHNEAARLGRCLDQLLLEVYRYAHEIILVENGSHDGTLEHCKYFERMHPQIKVIQLTERGKGVAVRAGMLAASGRYRYMCDVDLSTPAAEIHRFLEMARQWDVVIGSREKDRRQVVTTFQRRAIGRLIHIAVDAVLPGIQDSQCGFKMFRDYAAVEIFEQARIDGIAFDVEALYLARQHGHSIFEMSVPWVHNSDSRMEAGDGISFLWDVFSLCWRRTIGQRLYDAS